MGNAKRGTQGIKTMGGLIDRRRARTSAGALMELAILANERIRLQQEVDRWRQRQAEIDGRLVEIADKESRLYGFVNKTAIDMAGVGNSPRQNDAEPYRGDNRPRLRSTEFSY